MEMRYRQNGSEVQQIRYLVTNGDAILHLVFLAPPPLADQLARWIVSTLRFDDAVRIPDPVN